MLRDVLGSPRSDDFGAFGMRVLLSTTRPIASQQLRSCDGNVHIPALWDGSPGTVIDIQPRDSGIPVVGLRQSSGMEESSSREAINSFEMKHLHTSCTYMAKQI